MEELQSALQSVLSDPEQMRRVTAIAESLGLKPPAAEAAAASSARPSERREESAFLSQANPSERREESVPRPPQGPSALPNIPAGLDLSRLMSQLSAMQGTEDRVLAALRPSLSPAGQGKADRALRAAKLARLAGQFLSGRREAHV